MRACQFRPTRKSTYFDPTRSNTYLKLMRVARLGCVDPPGRLWSECQRRRLNIDCSSLESSMTSRPPNTSLPQKLGCLESEVLCKLLKRWSGRWDSNPRRPAWEAASPTSPQSLL